MCCSISGAQGVSRPLWTSLRPSYRRVRLTRGRGASRHSTAEDAVSKLASLGVVPLSTHGISGSARGAARTRSTAHRASPRPRRRGRFALLTGSWQRPPPTATSRSRFFGTASLSNISGLHLEAAHARVRQVARNPSDVAAFYSARALRTAAAFTLFLAARSRSTSVAAAGALCGIAAINGPPRRV